MIATPTEIQYFIETYKIMHISKAALRLGITQPTLTQCLQKLESKLNAKLFIRTKQGVHATGAGKIFYSSAQLLMENWNNTSKEIVDINHAIKGRFKVGCHQSVGAYTIPKLLYQINQKAPKIEITLIHDFSRKITEGIISYQIDLGFIINPVKHPDLILKKIGSDRIMFWKKPGKCILPKRIISDSGISQVQSLLGRASRDYFKDWTSLESSSLELVRTLTLGGQGVGILPERVALADQYKLEVYDKNLPVFEDEVYVAYRPELLISQAGKTLARLSSLQL